MNVRIDPATGQNPNRRRTNKRILIGAGVVLAFVVLASCMSGGDSTDTPAVTATGASSTVDAAAQPAASVAPATKDRKEEGAVSQRNALRKAHDYLDMTGFSKTGLIKQLSSEYGDGFSTVDATWAVNHLKVDWNEQAARKGMDYLDMTGFSRASLIQQLSSPYGDGFTKAQATYAANKLGL